MNIIRFRDKIKGWIGAGIAMGQDKHDIPEAPVFIVGKIPKLNEQEIEWVKQHIVSENGTLVKSAPYPVFSIIYKNDERQEEQLTHSAVIFSSNPVRVLIGGGVMKETVQRYYFTSEADGLELVCVSGMTGSVEKGMMYHLYKDRVLMDINAAADRYGKRHGDRQKYEEFAADVATLGRDVVRRFLFDLMNPNNAVVRVQPEQQGRSVQWVKARTHYCIINKSQAIRCRDQKRGPTDHEIDRAAHWRRAHMRRLRSEKFKHKQGQLVFVKRSWVGPEEWVGTDKKIYKVINLDR